jgi:hypothetical protein
MVPRQNQGGQAMARPRRAMFSVVVALSVIWPLAHALADQAFQKFLPLLVDLDGWQGKKADGMSMEMTNMSMTTATRDYGKGSAKAHATVTVGQAAEGALAPFASGMNIQTADSHMVTSTMHGMAVLKTFNSKDKSGTLIVQLGKDAMFSFAYDGITEDEAMPMAEKFDWKALQTAAGTK